MLGVFNHFERTSWMPWLSSALFATFVPQAFGFLSQPITGGRFPAVAAVFGYLIFQSLDPIHKLAEGSVKQHNDSIFSLSVGCPNFIFFGKAERFHISILAGFCDFGNVYVQSGFLA
jgi:hypothetical protein